MIDKIVTISLNEANFATQEFCSNPKTKESLVKAATLISNSLKNGGKVIACGNGGSCCDAMHFCEELTGRFRKNRLPYSAIAISDPAYISCVANDFGFEFVYSRFVQAVGNAGDVLIAISTSGKSENVLNAMEMARKNNISVIGLTGGDFTEFSDLSNVTISTQKFEHSDRIQELHIKSLHIIVECIEAKILEY